MAKGKMSFSNLVIVIIAGMVVSTSFAGLLEIKEMQFSFQDLPYYSNQTLGFNQASTIAGDVAIPTGPGTVDYAYTIQGAVVALSGMDLVGGLGTNTGTFGGPAILTVTGDLVKTSTETSLTGGAVVLFEAEMIQDTLTMTEVLTDFAAGGAFFNTIGGALLTGVADGAMTLVLEDFEMGLWGKQTQVLFGAENAMTPPLAQLQITTDAVPEPATLALLSVGLLAVVRKRK